MRRTSKVRKDIIDAMLIVNFHLKYTMILGFQFKKKCKKSHRGGLTFMWCYVKSTQIL